MDRNQPPRWATTLLGWWADPNTLEEVQGDLLELYTYWVQTVGVRKADWRYALSALKLLRPLAKRETHYPKTYIYSPTMIRNYFKIAFRNLARNKVYSFINIAGLCIGLACAMLIMLYVKDEVSFDRFHKNANNIYRIARGQKGLKGYFEIGSTGFLQGPRFMQNVPGIKSFVRVQGGSEDIKNGTAVQEQNGVLHVDSNFFSVLTFPLLAGDPKTCLTEPHSIVLSEDAAKKYFATTDAVGKVMMIKEDTAFVPYKVTAVAKRCPQNSSIQFTALMPLIVSDADAKDTHNWFNLFLNTFVVLDEKANMQTVENQMQRFYVADAKATFYEMLKNDGGDPSQIPMGTYLLQPYLDIHLSTQLPAGNGLTNASNPMYSYLLSGIALFVLLIACINFVNLTVARSVKRAKEIGIRKVVGSDRKQLIVRFLGESFFLCTVAFVLAIVLVQFLLPLFNGLSNKVLTIAYLFDAKLIAGYIALYIITGLLAGFYPALVLSGYNPVQTLYSRFQIAGKNYLQKSLVVLQFTLASSLIIATGIIYAQFNLLTKTDLGYDDSNLVIVNKNNLDNTDAFVFKNELLKNPNIIGVSIKNAGNRGTGTKNFTDGTVFFADETIDENYLPLLKIPLVAGRNFSKAFPADSAQSIIVNESFVKAAKWKNPIGETVQMLGNSNETYSVIGVVKDYHFAPLTQKITPQAFSLRGNYGTYYIKIKPNTAATSLKWIQRTYQQFYPMDPYAYVFKNEENRKQYADVEKWKQIILFSAILTIFISCIGLFGLSLLSVEKRTKEIGIRKVLGASVQQIVTTLSSDFIKLVVFALIIASPLAYMVANKWLQNYPYRIEISWWLFASAEFLVVIIALFTVSFHSIKTAVSNPVKSLRNE
ncbi:ABC transporter permease [Runella sp.]|uniref:ABC transporter permease n=1 Tax=Runella sp. TaxID=1960881 RepID=UPI003D100A62